MKRLAIGATIGALVASGGPAVAQTLGWRHTDPRLRYICEETTQHNGAVCVGQKLGVGLSVVDGTEYALVTGKNNHVLYKAIR